MPTASATSRYYVLTDKSQLAFFPIGFLGLLLIVGTLLFGLLRFAKLDIEASVQQSVSDRLQQQGFDWVNVNVSGQRVTLSGLGTQEEGDKAIALARTVTGETWLGAFAAPTKVKGIFAAPEKTVAPQDSQSVANAPATGEAMTAPLLESMPESSSEPVSESTPTASSEPMPEPIVLPPEWGQFKAEIDNGTLRLTGYVENEARIEAIQAAIMAQDRSGRFQIIANQLQVAPWKMIEGSEVLENRVLEAIPWCQSGVISSANGELGLNCQTQLTQAESLQSMINQPLEVGSLDRVSIDITDDCNRLLREKLATQNIQFAVNSAQLRNRSGPLLNELAQLLNACPREIKVEGHTDDTGSMALNMNLSQRRAETVVAALVDLGVDESRLSAMGFGPSQPIAEGTSPADRAKNRRIEIKLVDGANE